MNTLFWDGKLMFCEVHCNNNNNSNN